MKLIKTIYTDKNGNEWEVEKSVLPKKKGQYVFWIGECKKLNKCYKANKKRDLLNTINK